MPSLPRYEIQAFQHPHLQERHVCHSDKKQHYKYKTNSNYTKWPRIRTIYNTHKVLITHALLLFFPQFHLEVPALKNHIFAPLLAYSTIDTKNLKKKTLTFKFRVIMK